MPSFDPQRIMQSLLDRLNRSRFLSISVILHILIVAVFGGTVLFQVIQEPPDFEGESGGFVSGGDAAAPPQAAPVQQTETNFTVTAPTTQSNPMSAITTTSSQALDFTMPQITTPTITPTQTLDAQTVAPAAPTIGAGQMTAGEAAAIAGFTGGWTGGKGRGTGSGTGVRQREFEFIAYLGRYKGGNWNSTVAIEGGKIVRGSLPNLLYMMTLWSNDKIKTNERNVEAIPLDSEEIFTKKPPFIFMTGTRDFKLTDKEVENLRKYIRLGGCIWGDSSVPGRNSRFDIAFRREMKRIIGDVDKDWEELPDSHPIFQRAYFPEIRTVPPGLNFYQEPVYALKIYDEIAILYTANDYGDMWQIGLTKDGKIDMGRDARGREIATNTNLWNYRDVYLGNLTPESVAESYKFGINVVVHLLTRWEDKVSRAGPRL